MTNEEAVSIIKTIMPTNETGRHVEAIEKAIAALKHSEAKSLGVHLPPVINAVDMICNLRVIGWGKDSIKVYVDEGDGYDFYYQYMGGGRSYPPALSLRRMGRSAGIYR